MWTFKDMFLQARVDMTPPFNLEVGESRSVIELNKFAALI